MTPQPEFVARAAALYRRTLLEDVAPFWLRHGFDREHGGISNVVDDQGRALNHDKYLWSQGRALWTFAALCRRLEPRPEWRAFADHLYAYLRTHGRDDQGRWMFRLDDQGRVLDRDTSIFADSFVLIGLTEYYRATGKTDALDLALATYENVQQRLQQPGGPPVAPYRFPQELKPHGVRMIFSFFFDQLGRAARRADIIAAGRRLADEIFEQFYVPEHDAILEHVTHDGRFSDSPAGRLCVPGHALEALWFTINTCEKSGDQDRIRQCSRLIRRHLERGWDPDHGGLRLALDIQDREPCWWAKADGKPWWVQCEALVATAYAWVHTGEDWCLDWHRRVQKYAYAHYPVPTGEWRQWLDRTGQPMASAALPVKDPFHLPRALLYLIGLFGRNRSGAPPRPQ
ncbi:AGE family epimerase/isomerase [bacterium]|nr:AGE family epimerase/isomerase [bacterium]